jgi:hypothetical protein
MRRSAPRPLDRTKLPLILAAGLQAAFADIAARPLSERLAPLVSQLGADCTGPQEAKRQKLGDNETPNRADR